MENEKFISFRVPIELAEQAKKRAKSQHRSLQGHMLHLIENDLSLSVQGKAAPSFRPSQACDDDKIIYPEKLYPNGLPAEMRGSKTRRQSASKKLPKKTA